MVTKQLELWALVEWSVQSNSASEDEDMRAVSCERATTHDEDCVNIIKRSSSLNIFSSALWESAANHRQCYDAIVTRRAMATMTKLEVFASCCWTTPPSACVRAYCSVFPGGSLVGLYISGFLPRLSQSYLGYRQTSVGVLTLVVIVVINLNIAGGCQLNCDQGSRPALTGGSKLCRLSESNNWYNGHLTCLPSGDCGGNG